MKNRFGVLCLLAGLCLLLSGCFVRTVDDLYQLPAAPDDYLNLQSKIDEIRAQGAESISPLSGERIQNVQLEDLDGDGVQEAIAFFRVTTDAHPLQIYIFRQTGESYEVASVIKGPGTAIYTVDYQNMDKDPAKEVAVVWEMSDKIRTLAVFSLTDYRAGALTDLSYPEFEKTNQDPLADYRTQQLVSTDYTEFQITDLDRDNVNELLVFKKDGLAEYYDAGYGVLELHSSAPMSKDISGIAAGGVKVGYLKDCIPAVFVQSYQVDADSEGAPADPILPAVGNAQIIDIFACRNGRLVNITLDEDTGESGETIRFYTAAGCMDINGDSIMEVPQPMKVPDYKATGAAANFWLIEWRQYDLDGNAYPVYTTYYNDRDGWYLIVPDEWIGRITLSRSDLTGGGERAVIFSYWDPASGAEPQKFLTIYRLTGNNRVMWAGLPGRFRLDDETGEFGDVIYAAEFRTSADGGWDCGLDEQALRERFHLIRSGWSVGF